jgi:hypothetical protein
MAEGQRTCGDKRAYTWDHQSGDTKQPAAEATEDPACHCTTGRTRTDVGACVIGHLLRVLLVRRQDADRVRVDIVLFKRLDRLASIFVIVEHADDCGTWGRCHGW